MAEVKLKSGNYSLLNLYSAAFGIKVKQYALSKAVNAIRGAQLSNNLEVKDFEAKGYSIMGTKLFMPCSLDDPKSLGLFKLPDEPICELQGGKRLIKTEIDGMDGTFKELFALDDYRITIRGLVVQEDGTDNYPQEDVRRIRDYCELEREITINCHAINLFGINQIVIESWDFPAMEGFPGVQPYVLSCVSDKTIDLELKTNNG